MGQLKLQLGRVEYIDHNVTESLLQEKELASVADFIFDIKHMKDEDCHLIEIKIIQGIEKASTNQPILTIESLSKFKISPYTSSLFRQPAPADLVNILSDFAQTAAAHNAGMFSVIRDDYGLGEINILVVPVRKVKEQIFNQTKRFLLN